MNENSDYAKFKIFSWGDGVALKRAILGVFRIPAFGELVLSINEIPNAEKWLH